jgi:hypothetical protein
MGMEMADDAEIFERDFLYEGLDAAGDAEASNTRVKRNH